MENFSPKTQAWLEAIGKTCLTVALGAIAGVIDNVIQNPGGSVQAYLTANPQSAEVGGLVLILVHNFLSRVEAAGQNAAIDAAGGSPAAKTVSTTVTKTVTDPVQPPLTK